MNRKITILGNSAAGAAAAAVLSKHNTVTVTMDPADCADAEYVLVAYKTKFSKLKKNYDTAAIEKALPEVRKAASHRLYCHSVRRAAGLHLQHGRAFAVRLHFCLPRPGAPQL